MYGQHCSREKPLEEFCQAATWVEREGRYYKKNIDGDGRRRRACRVEAPRNAIASGSAHHHIVRQMLRVKSSHRPASKVSQQTQASKPS